MQPPSLSRREWLQLTGLSPLALATESVPAFAQEKQPAPPPTLVPLNRYGRAVQEWYVEQVRAATNDVDVPVGQRVERARIDGDNVKHRRKPSRGASPLGLVFDRQRPRRTRSIEYALPAIGPSTVKRQRAVA